MSRIRLGVVLLLVGLAGAAALLSTSSSHASAQGRPWTHRLTSVTGELVDHWTYNDPAPRGAVGEGTVTLRFRLVKPRLVTLIIDPSKNGEPNNSLGSWIVGIPGPTGGIRDTPALPASGTVTWVDNTTQRPPDPGGDCTPTDKTGCGTAPISACVDDQDRRVQPSLSLRGPVRGAARAETWRVRSRAGLDVQRRPPRWRDA